MLHLEPDMYPCPTHGHELRPLVEEALDEQVPPAAYGKKRRPFEVLVSCPGAAGEAHRQACSGRYWR